MNYVVSLVGSLRIDPPLEPFAVRVLNQDFREVSLLVTPPDVWARIRFRVTPDGTALVLNEEPAATQIESWGEHFWVGETLAYTVQAIAGFDRRVTGSLHRRGDHRDDIFVLRVVGEEVYEHAVAYATEGKLMHVPDERMMAGDEDWQIVDGDD